MDVLHDIVIVVVMVGCFAAPILTLPIMYWLDKTYCIVETIYDGPSKEQKENRKKLRQIFRK